jgi:Ca2+-transporting ATPase
MADRKTDDIDHVWHALPVEQLLRHCVRRCRATIGCSAPLIAAVTFGWFAWRLGQGAALEIVRTETFTVLAMCQWFNVLNCQSATASALGPRIVRNRWLLGGLTLSMLLQALVLYAPAMNALFHTVPLPPESLLPPLVLASAVLWVEEARKLWVRTMHRARP